MITQATLARFIERGLLAQHIRKVMREYAARHVQILDSLERRLRPWLRPIPSTAGLHLTATAAGKRTNVPRALRRVQDHGVRLGLLSSYCVDAPQEGIVIGYGAIPSSRIDEGLRRLAASFT